MKIRPLRMSLLAVALWSLCGTGQAWAFIETQTVEYKDGDVVLEGYLAYDDLNPDQRPGILIVHEWKGINEYSKQRAEQLAVMGYVAMAVDMYGKGVQAKDHEEAAKLSGIYRNDRNLMRQRVKAALDVLKDHPLVMSSKLAAIGYCFGGTTVLEMARAGMDIDAVVSFHGGLSAPIPATKDGVKAKVLVCHGADDKFVTKEEVEAFKQEMDAAGVDYRFIEYPGAVHSFTVPTAGNDPSAGMAYNAEADEKSWKEMKDFLAAAFTDPLALDDPNA